ncbi:ferrous iron transport protein B [Sulfurihydrogenibium sp.]|uniref:ferrous iron transport protein B n=1 Tax=Sulfurihydrogenibium sp. TaxID=2053621 RepID=UPI00261077E3|nr:ferrous iron transport protein B [Sulfurihydrogenibium sp.]
MKDIVVALVGNPNVGKSALLNAISGAEVKVGNWPGVTVEKLEATFIYKNYKIHFVDLPGVYSLRNQTAEEKVTIDFLLKEKPDIILNVVDSTNLKRNLYLTVQLLELELPMVIALNIWDEAVEKGIVVDYEKMSKLLCVPVIPTSAKDKTGLNELLDKLIDVYENKKFVQCEHFETQIEEYLKKVINLVSEYQPILLDLFPKRYLAVSLLEGTLNEPITSSLEEKLKQIREEIKSLYKKDIKTVIVEERYGVVLSIYHQTVKKQREDVVDSSITLDKIFLHKYLGIPIFLLLVWIVFEITFKISSPYVEWLDKVLGVVSSWTLSLLDMANTPDMLKSFVAEGVLGGVGFVLVFVPVLFTLYIMIAILEGSGYISRAAFLMDRFFSSVGLSGKSFIPLLLGFGCNVPAVYATKTIENEREKILTTLMIPFMSCGARLTVFAFFVSVFFTSNKGLVIFSLYLIGIGVAVLVAVLLNKFYFKTKSQFFIMELPPYRLPTFKYVINTAWVRVKAFIVEAGTFIFAMSVLVWFLTNIPYGAKKDETILANVSKKVAVIFQPLGFGTWEATASLFSGFVAKEVVLSTMGNIYVGEKIQEEKKETSFTEGIKEIATGFIDANINLVKNFVSIFGFVKKEEEEFDKSLADAIRSAFNPASAYSFLVFLLLYTPCLATVFAIKQELNSYKWMFLSIAINFTAAWIVSFIVYNVVKDFL